jgi:syntaxin 8
MTNPTQLFLLADHIKLSLLERQRAISLDLEPNSQDGEISRSLESLREGIEAMEADQIRLTNSHDSAGAAALKDQLAPLQAQYQDLSTQFHGADVEPTDTTAQASKSATPDLKQPIPQHPPSKSVRFMDNSAAAAAVQEEIDEEENRDRNNLFRPYRDQPSPPRPDQSGMDNQQIYDHHAQTMRDQDDQLDRLGESIGRQHQLSIQIGDELDGHVQLLDGMDGDVERHQTRLDGARRRIDRIRRKAGDNWSMMTIIGLIIVLVILIVILK